MCLSNLGLAGDHKIYEPDKAPFSILVVDRINLFGDFRTLTVCIEFKAKTRVFGQVIFIILHLGAYSKNVQKSYSDQRHPITF